MERIGQGGEAEVWSAWDPTLAADPIVRDAAAKRAKVDFRARLNPPGTWIEFPSLATDGSVKINREADRLVVFPYPRDQAVHVRLDLKALAPSVEPGRVSVRALAAGTGRDLGPIAAPWSDGRLSLTLEKPGAGRYVIEWK